MKLYHLPNSKNYGFIKRLDGYTFRNVQADMIQIMHLQIHQYLNSSEIMIDRNSIV